MRKDEPMSKNKLIFLCTIFIFVFIAGVAVCQDSSIVGAEGTKSVATSTETTATIVEDATEGIAETAPGNVTMDFKSADINNVLRILSYKSGVNIVAGPEVKGLVTIRLTNVPWEKALDVVLRTYGFSYEKVGNIIRVTTIESLKQEELTTEVYTLSYGKAEDVTEAIENMLTERGKTRFDERTNTLVVTDIPTNLYKISQIVEKLDRRTPQIMIEAKVIETTLADDERLGIDWNLQLSLTGASRPTSFPWGRFSEHDFEQSLTRFFPPGQTELTVADTGEALATTGDFPVTGGPQQYQTFPWVETTDFTLGSLNASSFSAAMEYLDTRTDTDILSHPRITTLDNQEANILVGQIIGIPTYERNSETGQMEITGYQDKQVGVKLNVIPHVNVEGDITVIIKPEISALLRYDTLDASRGIVAPVFSTREATTQVMVGDGETIMIGGLISKQSIDNVDKVPLLGDIPFIGKALFTKTNKDIDRTEVIIFLTVRLVTDKWVPPAGSAAAFAKFPSPHDAEVWEAVPRIAEKEKKKKWWQWW